jgi:hypothetical protein
MNIAAILDLDKAIETFKNKIQTLLLVGDLSDWDGTILQEREQEIRHTALELAGQCIQGNRMSFNACLIDKR